MKKKEPRAPIQRVGNEFEQINYTVYFEQKKCNSSDGGITGRHHYPILSFFFSCPASIVQCYCRPKEKRIVRVDETTIKFIYNLISVNNLFPQQHEKRKEN